MILMKAQHRRGIDDRPDAVEVATSALPLGSPTSSYPEKVPLQVLDRSVLDNLMADTDPALLGEFVGHFIRDTHRRAGRVATAVNARDLAALEHECHSIGSSAITFGAMQLHLISRRIELACRLGATDQALRLAVDLDPHIVQVELALLAHLAATG